jgi:hypothetical protein
VTQTGPDGRDGRFKALQWVGLGVCALLCASTFDLALVQHDAVGMWDSAPAFAAARAAFLHEAVPTVLGFLLTGALWLSLIGRLDRDPWGREDAWVLAPLLTALTLRLGVAPRSIEEIEIHLYDGILPTMHSYVVPLLGRALRGLPGDAHEHAFVAAGILGAWAVVPLYRFVTRRSGSVTAGLAAAMAFACHPILVRFAPTDAPYSLMLYALCVSLAALSAATPSVLGGALALAVAVSCRADGALWLPVVALLVGPDTWRALWDTQRRAVLVAAPLAASLMAVAWWSLIASQYTDERVIPTLAGLIPPISPWQVVGDTLAHGPGQLDTTVEIVARRAWQILAALGALAGLLDRRLRWASAALVGALILATPYERFSWTWPVGLHRVVPPSAMLAVAAGGGLAALAAQARRLGTSATVAVRVAVIVATLALALAAAPFLTRPWTFNVEWEMVRAALAPQGVEDPTCTVMGFGAKDRDDMDIHDFGQMLYGVDLYDCWRRDCVAEARAGGCHRYIRGLRCYAAADALSEACSEATLTAADARARCLLPECAAVEAALQLTPIEERTLVPAPTFEGAPMRVGYPAVAPVGVYDVVGVRP